MKKIFILASAIAIFVAACDTSKKAKTTNPADTSDIIGDYMMDDLNIGATAIDTVALSDDLEVKPYQAAAEQLHDLLHTKINVSFDWQKERVNGKATLTLKPYFYSSNELTLDAKNFDIKSVILEGKNTALKYDYDNEKLKITLDRTYTRTEEYKVTIDYVAKPSERKSIGGSQAITSDKGLFFINPRNEEMDKPQQIWTQGETENNSCWFPTFDKPNERCTGEIYITVADKYKTLSNGLLINSTKNNDGSRTDYWKMDQPHAPYLFMLAVGEFAVVKDKWENIDLAYYVEPKYEKEAKIIFPNTPEMLGFFSNKLGLKYPWQKYAQIVVRDYVSGAMENTTAVIFGEYMQGTERELIDETTNEKVVAHEMFHHWFGDYVTTESWSNLTLNEGFANYSEYLWLEHKYGKDAAQAHWKEELEGYFSQAANTRHSLVDFEYKNREDMFDAHSYNKGGMILHMLRNYLGDDAFFTALNTYLKKHAYTAVEVDELRMAFEDVTGKDLNWFFNQWYLNPGHPEVEASQKYDAVTGKLMVTIAQKQDNINNLGVYELPIAIDVYYAEGQKPQRFNVTTKKRKEIFTFNVKSAPKLVNLDAERVILWDLVYPKTEEEFAFQYRNAPHFLDRDEVIASIQNSEKPTAISDAVIEKAVNDSHFSIRERAINIMNIEQPSNVKYFENTALNDKHSKVRSAALFRLGQTGNKEYATIMQKVFEKERSFEVLSTALEALNQLDKEAAAKYLPILEKEESSKIVTALASVYADNPTAERLAFLEKKIDNINGMDAMSVVDSYAAISYQLGDDPQAKAITKLGNMGTSDESPWRRYAATRALAGMRAAYKEANNKAREAEVNTIITTIKEKESNTELKAIYKML